MELPLTPSARPGRAPRRCSGAPGAGERRRFFTGRRRLRDASLRGGGAYGTSPITGRRRLRDEPPYGTSLLTGRRRWDEPPCGPEAEALRGRASLRDGALLTGGAYGTSLLTGRRRLRASLHTEALSGPLRDEPPCAEELTDEHTNGTSPSRAGGAYGTSPSGGAYGTSVRTGRRRLRRPITGRNCFLTYGTDAEALAGLASLHNGGTDGTSLLAGRRRLRDEPVYGRVLTGRNYQRAYGTPRLRPEAYGKSGSDALKGGSLRGSAYGTSLRTGRRRRLTVGRAAFTGRRRWDEPPYRPEALTRDEPPPCAEAPTNGRAGGAYGTPPYRAEALTGRAPLRRLRDEPLYAPEAEAYGTSLLTGRRR